MGTWHTISVNHTRIHDIDSINLYGIQISQSLPYAEKRFDKGVSLEQTLTRADFSDSGYVFEVDSK